jgi:hypothetical protein
VLVKLRLLSRPLPGRHRKFQLAVQEDEDTSASWSEEYCPWAYQSTQGSSSEELTFEDDVSTPLSTKALVTPEDEINFILSGILTIRLMEADDQGSQNTQVYFEGWELIL